MHLLALGSSPQHAIWKLPDPDIVGKDEYVLSSGLVLCIDELGYVEFIVSLGLLFNVDDPESKCGDV